ncbi:MAG: motility associated factor glycosyltransferase family protein [Treponema sp.]
MNSHLNNNAAGVHNSPYFIENCRLFTRRFPELSVLLMLDTAEKAQAALAEIPPYYQLVPPKSRSCPAEYYTLTVDGTALHSQYNPVEEARRIVQSEFFHTPAVQQSCVFAGLGLGYPVLCYMEQRPQAEVIIVEPDRVVFLCFLAAASRKDFFNHQKLILLIGIPAQEAASVLIEKNYTGTPFRNAAAAALQKEYFEPFFALLERNRTKNSINAKTLERFGMLWLRNTIKNKSCLYTMHSISCFAGAFRGLPAVVLAGGPSLTRHLTYIAQSRQNYLIIAVDTAVRACIRASLVPDFILSFDPQYWNYLHTAGLDTSQSILITEAAVFPAVLRQKYRAVFLAQSSVPFVSYFAPFAEQETKLAAGGSVATTAWDFARFIGAATIIMAGLDLGFPKSQTHFAGSTFEENSHIQAERFSPAETSRSRSLYAAFPELRQGYTGQQVLTDRRMLLYAWWFESSLAKYPEVHTYNLLPEGITIPGMPACSADSFLRYTQRGLSRSEIRSRIQAYIAQAYSPAFYTGESERKNQLIKKSAALLNEMEMLRRYTETAVSITKLIEQTVGMPPQHLITQLDTIDAAIQSSVVKDILSILYTTEAATAMQNKTVALEVYQKLHLLADTACRLMQKYALS